jgi:hypothetical protein
MKPKGILLISTAIWGWGGFLLFHGLDALPLWLVWTMGPLCWYLGCAAMLVAGVMCVHEHFAARRKQTELESHAIRTIVLRFETKPDEGAPAGITREVPPMGGFLM